MYIYIHIYIYTCVYISIYLPTGVRVDQPDARRRGSEGRECQRYIGRAGPLLRLLYIYTYIYIYIFIRVCNRV